jgi:hypothetical protein
MYSVEKYASLIELEVFPTKQTFRTLLSFDLFCIASWCSWVLFTPTSVSESSLSSYSRMTLKSPWVYTRPW